MRDEKSYVPEDDRNSAVRGSSPPFGRRWFLRGVAGGVAGTVAAGALRGGRAEAATPPPDNGHNEDDYNLEATRDGTRSVPFYGQYQAGIATPPQVAATFLAFDVTAANRGELTQLFQTLTARAAFLTAGGTPPAVPPGAPPSDDRLLGPTVLPDDLTVTVAVGASLFDGRYGLGPRKPAQLETMKAFAHDNLDPAISDGDLLVQLCASHRDTVGHAMLDLLAHTAGSMRIRWRLDGFRFPPRPVGIPRDWMGFKDGIANPDTTNATEMNHEVTTTVALPARSAPAAVALSPNGQFLYIADGGSNSVSVLDTRTNRVAASVPVGSQPVSLAVTPDGASVYVANTGSGDVSVIDTRTNRTVRAVPTGQYPTGVAVTRDGASVYVANEVSNNVTVINTRSGATEAVIPAANPVGVTTSPNGLSVYVTDVSSGKLTVIDNRTHQVTSTVSVGAIPFNAAATNHAIYVVDQGANTLAVIDPRTLKVSTTVTTGSSPLARRSGGLPYGVAVNPPASGQ